MSDLRVINRDPASGDKEVTIQIDPVGSGGSGDFTYHVKGKIVNARGEGEAGYTVIAYHKRLVQVTPDDELGRTDSNSVGDYLIYYNTSQLPSNRSFADLLIVVLDSGGAEVARSPIYTNALPEETINLSVSSTAFVGDIEYDVVHDAIFPEIDGVTLSEIDTDGIAIISSATGFRSDIVLAYLKSRSFTTKHPTVAGEAFYGLFRYGLTYVEQDLLDTSPSRIREALESTQASKIIDPTLDINAILTAFSNLRSQSWLFDPVDVSGESYLAQILVLGGVTDVPTQESFVGAYLEYGDSATFWSDVVGNGILTQAQSDQVKLGLQLGAIAQDHFPLVEGVIGTISTIEDIGSFTLSDWQGHVDSFGVPNIAPGDITTEDRSNYALALFTATEQAFPTEVLIEAMSTDGAYNTSDAYNFLVANPAFDIKTDSPKAFFDGMGTAPDANTQTAINELRRLWFLATGPDRLSQIKLMQDNGLSSASQIAAYGRRNFIKKYGGGAVFSDTEAGQIYDKAAKRAAAAMKLQANYNPKVNNVSTAVYKDPSIESTSVPTLEGLFGSQDYCSCQHCKSSFGPAAYLIDLLTFLQQSEVYNDLGVATGQNAWQIFQTRRPELLKLELTCENTNTVMPYIDLVNEVLEYEVAGSGNLVRQTSFDVDTLRARPEHLNQTAYGFLSDGSNESVNGMNLPFDLWLEEVTDYLGLIGVTRSEMFRAVSHRDIAGWNATAAWASYFGFSDALNSVLSDATTFTKYYGGAVSADLQEVPVLLDKSGLTFEELTALLDSSFVNPNQLQIVYSPATSCDLKDATLAFTDVEYKNLHRFEKLRRKLGWTVEQLDILVSNLGITNFISGRISMLAMISQSVDEYQLDFEETLSWYGPLSEKSYGGRESHYERVFLNPAYHVDEITRTNFENGGFSLLNATELDVVNSPVVLAACKLSSKDLLLLLNSGEIADGNIVSKADLSHIYRISALSRGVGISVQEYLDLKNIIGIDPFFVTQDTIKFLYHLRVILQSNFSLDEIKLLFLHVGTEAVNLDDSSITNALETTKTQAGSRLSQKGITRFKRREDLLNLFNLFMSEAESSASVALVERVENDPDSINKANELIDTVWSQFGGDTTNIKMELTEAGGSILLSQARINAAFTYFESSLISELEIESEIIEALAAELGISSKLLTTIFSELSYSPLILTQDFFLSETAVSAMSNFNALKDACIRSSKVSLCIDKLNVPEDLIPFIISGAAVSNWYDLSGFPVSATATTSGFYEFTTLISTLEIENTYRSESFSPIATIRDSVVDLSKMAEAFQISESDASILDATFNNSSGQRFLQIEEAVRTVHKSGLTFSQIQSFSKTTYTYEESQIIQNVVKAQFSDAEWLNAAAEVRDKLRIKQRDALSNYLIFNNAAYQDTNGLFEHFLIDTEMAPCMLTSRLKLAISSVQLWVQRVRMNLEVDINLLPEQMDEWVWRKNYRVWEAARKIFMYPENWIEPELRDDKSPFFLSLEEELLEGEVNSQTAENAYLNYLSKLDETAILEISGVFREEELDTLHVFARTKNAPHQYFYRRREDGFRWTAWESMDVDIEGDHLIPVIFNRRPMLFWPVFSEVPQEVTNDDLRVETSGGQVTSDISGEVPVTYAEIKIAFSEWKNGKWQAKKLSKTRVLSSRGVDPSNYFFKVDIGAENDLRIDAYYHADHSNNFSHVGGFVMDNCTADVVVDLTKKTVTPATFSVKNAYRNNMKVVEEGGNDQFAITEKIYHQSFPSLGEDYNVFTDERVLLNTTPGTFKITYPVTGADLLSEVPFFFEDGNRVFFVEPSDQTFEKTDLINLPPRVTRVRRKIPVLTPTGVSELTDNRIENVTGGNDYEIRNSLNTSTALDDINDRRIVFY